MLAIFQSDSGFSFSFGAVGTIVVIAVVLLIFLAPLFNWVPDLIYWLVKRRRQTDEPGDQSPPPLPRQTSSRHDENAS